MQNVLLIQPELTKKQKLNRTTHKHPSPKNHEKESY